MTVLHKGLGDVAIIIMGTSPKGDTYNESGNGMPLLNGPTEFGPDYPDCTLYTTDPKRECEQDDLIFCVRGSTTGRMNWADKKYALGRGVCSFRGDSKEETKYIRYVLELKLKALLQFAGGATFPNLTKDALHSFQVPFPDNRLQIVEIISSYDELIENNRRRIQLLEESARLLYKEWFVQLRFPGHEHVNIIDGVPEGWSIKPLTEVSVVNEESLKKGFEGDIEYVDIASVSPNAINGTTWYEFEDAPGRARRVLKHKDIIWSCVRPNRRSHAFVWMPHDRLIASTGFAVISSNTISPCYLYQYLTTNNYVGYLTNNAGGAAYPAVTAKVFEKSEVLVPSKNLQVEFESFAEIVYQEMQLLSDQNKKLAQARDILLPRLMNGELAA